MKTRFLAPIALCLALAAAASLQSVHAATIAVTSTADSGPGTLRDALASAPNGDTIDLTGISGTILLTSSQLVVTNSVTIVGPGNDTVKIDGNATNRVFYVGSNTTATVTSLTITQGYADDGGGVYNDHATLTVTNCNLTSNLAPLRGGGVYNSGTLTVVGSTLSGNSGGGAIGGGLPSYGGGGIHSSGILTVKASALTSNWASYGGGVNIVAGTATISASALNGNSAIDGGGICSVGGAVTMIGSVVNGSSADDFGGGILNSYDAMLSVSGSTINSNTAGQDGGGVCNTTGLIVTNCVLSGNLAYRGSGGIMNSGNLTVLASALTGNSAGLGGGGIGNSGTLAVSASVLSCNWAQEVGGGIYNGGNGAVSNSTFSGNSAGIQGGGIYSGGTLTMSAVTMAENSDVSIWNGGWLQIGDTILEASITNASGTLVSLGYNLSSDAAGGDDHDTGPGGLLNAPGDIRNTDPMLGPLADNGGPTLTHALLPCSPATDQGKNFGLTTDQRGQPRPVDDPAIANAVGGDGSDIGAFEVQQTCRTAPFQVTAIKRIGTSSDLRLSYPTILGTNYVVQTRSNMVSSSWTSLPGTNVGIGVVMQSIVTNALTAPQGFYQIQQFP